jgi:hypothetical protein
VSRICFKNDRESKRTFDARRVDGGDFMRAAVLMLVLAVGGAAQAEETRSDRLIEKEAAGLSAAERNWPAWRGPHGTGVSSQTGVPLRWSADENITWKVPLAGEGNSTPIVWEDRRTAPSGRSCASIGATAVCSGSAS